jgi:hypothetical protein
VKKIHVVSGGLDIAIGVALIWAVHRNGDYNSRSRAVRVQNAHQAKAGCDRKSRRPSESHWLRLPFLQMPVMFAGRISRVGLYNLSDYVTDPENYEAAFSPAGGHGR